MKSTTRIGLVLITVTVIFVFLLNPVLKALADDGEDAWGEFINPDGSINWANLTYLGEVRAGRLDDDRTSWRYPGATWGCQIQPLCYSQW